jgi:RNA polymerase sigma-70 factor (ECF subfamily)
MRPVTNVTELLARWNRGDRDALAELMPLVYGELRRLAEHYMRQERSGHTLQPTALVNEAFLRLAGTTDGRFNNRVHFYGAAAQAMRRVLVDHARRAQAHKRGENPIGLSLDSIEAGVDVRHELVDLDAALTKLAAQAPQPARVVELRYFGGLSIEDTGALRRRVSGFADGQLGDASGDGWPDPGSVHQRFRHGCRGGGRRHTASGCAHRACLLRHQFRGDRPRANSDRQRRSQRSRRGDHSRLAELSLARHPRQ